MIGSDMTAPYTVAVLVGSTRKGSYSRLVADALAVLAPASLKLSQIVIGDMPFYNEDLDHDEPPPVWTEFRTAIKGADAVLFVTPEYNRSVPALLKNAVDVGSRPYGASVWDAKPGAVVSVSPGAMGGFGANHHLRQSLVFLNVLPLQQPEAYVGGAASLFGPDGKLTDPKSQALLQKFIEAFGAWIEKLDPK
jgi:chromate reductase